MEDQLKDLEEVNVPEETEVDGKKKKKTKVNLGVPYFKLVSIFFWMWSTVTTHAPAFVLAMGFNQCKSEPSFVHLKHELSSTSIKFKYFAETQWPL